MIEEQKKTLHHGFIGCRVEVFCHANALESEFPSYHTSSMPSFPAWVKKLNTCSHNAGSLPFTRWNWLPEYRAVIVSAAHCVLGWSVLRGRSTDSHRAVFQAGLPRRVSVSPD